MTLVRAALECGQAGGHRQQGAAGLTGGRGAAHRWPSEQGVDLLYEAAVAGAIPLVRALESR